MADHENPEVEESLLGETYEAENSTPISTSLKRKHQSIFASDSESNVETQTVVGEGRIIFVHRVATQPFNILLSQNPGLPDFLLAVLDEAPCLEINSLYGYKMSPQIVVLLQETGGGNRRHHAWTTITRSSLQTYKSWFNRNIIRGKAEKLRFEVQILQKLEVDGDEACRQRGTRIFEEKARESGMGDETSPELFATPYGTIWTRFRGVDSPLGFIRHCVPLDDIEDIDVERSLASPTGTCWQWQPTCQWFRVRSSGDPEKENRKGHRVERKRRERARNTTEDSHSEGEADLGSVGNTIIESIERVEELVDPQGEDVDFFADDEGMSSIDEVDSTGGDKV